MISIYCCVDSFTCLRNLKVWPTYRWKDIIKMAMTNRVHRCELCILLYKYFTSEATSDLTPVFNTSVLTSRICLNSVDMDASLDCKARTTLDECDWRWRPFCCDCFWLRDTSWSFAICWFRLFKSSFIMYVSSCISVGRSLKSDFRFATEI